MMYNNIEWNDFMINLGMENEEVEFKKTTSEIDSALLSIGAMLNKKGKGKIYFGVKNNGDVIGQQIGESTLRDISRKISEAIRPVIYPSIYEMAENHGVIVVEFNGNDRPYSVNGKFYIRLSDEDRQMDIKELLKEINHTDSSNSIWEKIDSDESLDDVDEDLLKQYILKANQCGRIKEKYTNVKEVMTKLGLYNGNYINNAGKILFSKNKPLVLQLAVFTSDEMLSYIDIDRQRGNLFELVDKEEQYIKQHIDYAAEIVGLKRVEEPEIPLEAIREIVLNSFCHSSFDLSVNNKAYLTPTRIVVFNPGTFPTGYVPDDFAYHGVMSVLRNPMISQILYYSNDIDAWSSGFKRVYDLCQKKKIKTTYAMNDQGFSFTFFRKGFNDKCISLDELVYSIIVNNPKISSNDIANLVNKTQRTVLSSIKKLKDAGKIERVGGNKTGFWIVKNNEVNK